MLFSPPVQVLLSDLGVIAVLAGLITWGKVFGAMYPLLHYGLPYLFVNAWLVGYTWLQHTRQALPARREFPRLIVSA